jgi:hypothetical protein
MSRTGMDAGSVMCGRREMIGSRRTIEEEMQANRLGDPWGFGIRVGGWRQASRRDCEIIIYLWEMVVRNGASARITYLPC